MWEFLGATKSLIGNHAMGLLDLAKAITFTPDKVSTADAIGIPLSSKFVPNIPTVLFDELCCNLTAILLCHTKDSIFFPGIKALLNDAKSGPDDPMVCKQQLSGFASSCASSLGDGLYNGEPNLPISFKHMISVTQAGQWFSLNESLEGMWQDILMSNPLNVLTWPVVAHRVLSVLAYVDAIQHHDEDVQSKHIEGIDFKSLALKKGALLSLQIFNQLDDFGSNSYQDRALILDLWLVLLNHPSSGSIWNKPQTKGGDKISSLMEIEEKLVRGVNVESGVDVYSSVTVFIADVKQVLDMHTDATSVTSTFVDMKIWFEDVAETFVNADVEFIQQRKSMISNSSLMNLTSTLRSLTRVDPEMLGKHQRLAILEIFLQFGVNCVECKRAGEEIREFNMSKMNEAIGGGSNKPNGKRQADLSLTIVEYPELYPLVIAPPHILSASLKTQKSQQSPSLSKLLEGFETVPIPDSVLYPGRHKKVKHSDCTSSVTSKASESISNFCCHFTALEPKHLSNGGEWIYLPDELSDVKVTAPEVEEQTQVNSERPARQKRLASEVMSPSPASSPRRVCLRAVATKIACVRDSISQVSATSSIPPLAGTLAYFYPSCNGHESYQIDNDRVSHVSQFLFTFPLGLDRLGREYFFCNAQRDNLLAGLNMIDSSYTQKEPGLLVRHKKVWSEWRYIKMENMANFLDSLDDSHPCEKILKQRLHVEFPVHKNYIRNGVGFFIENESDWFEGYEQTENWLKQLSDDIANHAVMETKHEGEAPVSSSDYIRKLEIAFARAADTRLVVHSAIISCDIDDDNHEYAYKGLVGLDWSTLTTKEFKRMADLKRRHKRSKLLELAMEFHPVKGWLRQEENFERFRQIGAATMASRIHSEPHLLDQIRISHSRSRYANTRSHSRFNLALSLKKNEVKANDKLVYGRPVIPSTVPHMIPSTVICSHRMLKLKTELLNIVAILPQDKLNFRMKIQTLIGAVTAVIPEKAVDAMREELNVVDIKVPAAEGSCLESKTSNNFKGEAELLPNNKRARESADDVIDSTVDHAVKRVAIPDPTDERCVETTVLMSNIMCPELSEPTNGLNTEVQPKIKSSVVDVPVSKYVELVQSCTRPSDLFLLVVMLEQASGIDFGTPVLLSLSRISFDNKTPHVGLSHVARRLYSLDRTLRYDEIERINTVPNGPIVDCEIIATSAVNYRPRIDYLPKCIHNPLCFRPMCHYHKCMTYNPETDQVLNPTAPGFNIRAIFPTQDSIPPRFGMKLLTSDITLSVNNAGQLQPGWNHHTTRNSTTMDVENQDNWRTIKEYGEKYDADTCGDMDDEIAEVEDIPTFREQRLHVSVVQPFVPSMSEITQSEWV